MLGPDIICNTLSRPHPTGPSKALWQYHGRGDRHSKVACWAILLDLLAECRLFARDAAAGLVGFGINHPMRDFKNDRDKALDLVICRLGTGPLRGKGPLTLADFVPRYGIALNEACAATLSALPILRRAPVGEVMMALEAKACMTEHSKALPRLYDELNSSHNTVHGAHEHAIAVGFVMVNSAPEFVSPGRGGTVTTHVIPKAPSVVVDKVRQLPRRSGMSGDGFDALGLMLVRLVNDGSDVVQDMEYPSPKLGDPYHYETMIRRIASQYEARFGGR